MELKNIKKYSVKLPFTQKVNHQSITHKEGAYLYFSDDLGRELIGDISPFPGFSPYSINNLIIEFQKEWNKNKLKSSENPHLEFLEYQLKNYLNFGGIKEDSNTSTKVNTLLRANELKHLSSSSQFTNINQEFPICFKIKAQTEKDIESIEHFITSTQNLENKLSIRIDSNGTWTSKEAIKYFQILKKAFEESPLITLDYFEEPLNSKEEYKKLF
ncbi:MAG: hypothetical protein NXH75_13830, partial [Halobacteriovoraceae bacterium]|nr:hypothetical protein [Halobacteriovoraceae bacterium]